MESFAIRNYEIGSVVDSVQYPLPNLMDGLNTKIIFKASGKILFLYGYSLTYYSSNFLTCCFLLFMQYGYPN